MSDTATLPLIPWNEIKLGKKLGEGGFGIVYRGSWAPGTKEEVAIKKIKGAIGDDAAKELKREAAVMHGLQSDYIIRLFGLCWEHQNYALVMELMPNFSLYDLLHNGQPLPLNIRYNIAQDVAYGLRLLHSRHILHRDIKSLNVLLDGKLRAKLTDFGLAAVKSQSRATTKADNSAGTIAWMSPELFEGEPCTKASDTYAYGIVSWELASREVPYSQAANQYVIPTMIMAGKRPKIPQDCDPTFAGLIESCWAQDPQQRPNMDKVISTLGTIMQAEASTAKLAVATSKASSAPSYELASSLGLVSGPSPEQLRIKALKDEERIKEVEHHRRKLAEARRAQQQAEARLAQQQVETRRAQQQAEALLISQQLRPSRSITRSVRSQRSRSEKIADYYENHNMTQEEVGNHFGVSKSTVSRYYNKYYH